MLEELVSIIVPVYNAEKYLDDCIDSLVKQSYKNIEIIFINDGSTDNSVEILSKWEKIDSRIKVKSQKNEGVSKARKLGVECSTGVWITFVDSDDVMMEKGIELLHNSASDCDVVVGQVKYTGKWPWPYVLNDEKIDSIHYNELLMKDQIHSGPWARLFKRDLFLSSNVFDIPRKISHGEDTLMNFRIAGLATNIRLISDEVYHYIYREHSASLCSKFDSWAYCDLYDKLVWKSLCYDAKKKLWILYIKSICKRRNRWLRKKIVSVLRKIGVKK